MKDLITGVEYTAEQEALAKGYAEPNNGGYPAFWVVLSQQKVLFVRCDENCEPQYDIMTWVEIAIAVEKIEMEID